MEAVYTAALGYLRHGLEEVPGWLGSVDAALLVALDDQQRRAGLSGDLLEVGVYEGTSAILLGYFLRPGERFYVCDPFGEAVGETEARAEQQRYYAGLCRERFERNYVRFHPQLPEIVEAASSALASYGLSRTFRLVHIDGSHAYDDVRQDLALSRSLLAPRGVVVVDDISAGHVPGVAAAVWRAVAEDGLRPFALGAKLFATWGEEPPVLEPAAIAAALGRVFRRHDHRIDGHVVARYEDHTPPSTRSRLAQACLPPAALPLAARSFRLVARPLVGRARSGAERRERP